MGKETGIGDETTGGLVWDIRTGSEWLELAAEMPEPKKLFGECWLEGEIALMFGDTGKGKSVLAVQIAEMLTLGGEGPGPIENSADVEKVLLVDLELSAKQFAMRYSTEGGPGGHDFSPNFSRVSVSVPFGGGDFIGEFCRQIREYLGALGAKVLIVDHVTAVRCSQNGTAAVAELMSGLRRMRDELGLSVLMLAQSPKREMHRPISINDLGALKYFGSMADSIFAIGQSRIDPELRYLKQVKTRSTALVFAEDNVAVFRLAKRNGGFLGLEFVDTCEEEKHLAKHNGAVTATLISEMQRLADNGWSQREIADHFNTSKTRVNRLMLSAQAERRPPAPRAPQQPQIPLYQGLESCIYEQCEGCDECQGRPGANPDAEGEDEAREHDNCPDFCKICGPRVYKDDDDVDDKTRSASENFFANLRYWLINGKNGERPEYISRGIIDERNDDAPAAIEPEQETVEIRYRGPDQNPDIVRDPNDRMAGLKRTLDGNKREIFIEEEFENGEQRIWYRYDSKGRIDRWVRIPGAGNHGDGTFDQLPPRDTPTDNWGRLCREPT